MPKLTLKPGQKVEAAYYDVTVTLKRQVADTYGADDLGSVQFHVPLGSEESGIVPRTLRHLRQTFEDAYGPVVPAPVPVLPVAERGDDEPVRVADDAELLPF